MTAIRSISIRSFQSLTSLDLTLSPFTVIVGPSSSGKSAFVRALQTLAHNQRGTAFITQGKPGCSITATLPTGSVSLTRSKSSSASDAYIVSTGQGTETDPISSQRFTKLGGSTPPEVTAALGQIADPSAIAAQFDSPYLLTQSPAEAARTLAALTGSHLLLEGAREANRQRLDAASSLRATTQDQQDTARDLAQYPDHLAQQSALDRAEPAIAAARAAEDRLATLEGLIGSIDYRATGLRTLRQSLASLPKLPSADDLDAAQKVAYKISALHALRVAITQIASSIRNQRDAITVAEQQIARLDQQRTDLLHALGVCPTCGHTV